MHVQFCSLKSAMTSLSLSLSFARSIITSCKCCQICKKTRRFICDCGKVEPDNRAKIAPSGGTEVPEYLPLSLATLSWA